jgi:acetolactate synthase-1/2/3 large subunit
MRSYNPVVKGHRARSRRRSQLLLEAKRPMIYTGGGVVLGDASAEADAAGADARLPGAPTR